MDYAFVAKMGVLADLLEASNDDRIAKGAYHNQAWRLVAEKWLLYKHVVGARCAVCGSGDKCCIGPIHTFIKGEHWKDG